MPHKKAKRSVRERDKRLKGTDTTAADVDISNEEIPKSAYRVLHAESIRDEYHEKRKRRLLEEQGNSNKKNNKKRKITQADTPLKIMDGESIQRFHKRVENNMRGSILDAVVKKKKSKAAISIPADSEATPTPIIKEFQTTSTSTPKRLNDVALAPPSLVLKRKPPTMAHKLIMEREREKAIAHYRELKAFRLIQSNPES